MRFLFPQLLWLGLIAIIPILLYLFRRKARRQVVSSLIFFKSLAKEHRESAWLRTLKRLLSLLLTLLVIAAAVLALARLVPDAAKSDVKAIVVVFDQSASMSARNAGESAIERGRKLLQSKLAAMPSSTELALVAFDARSEVLQPWTRVQREFFRALQSIEARPVQGDLDTALATASRLASTRGDKVEIWLVSDQPPSTVSSEALTDLAELAKTAGAPNEEGNTAAPDELASVDDAAPTAPPSAMADLVFLDASQPNLTNVGISAFQVRGSPLEPGKFELFLQVVASQSNRETVEAKVEISTGGSWITTPRMIELAPGKTETLVMDLDNMIGGQELEVQITGIENDALAWDDVAFARLPEARATVIAWISDSHDPFTELALSAISGDQLDVRMGGPDAWPSAGIDLVIFDGWLPETWSPEIPAIVISPPQSSGPIRAVASDGGIPREEIRNLDGDHPVLFRITSGRVAVTQTAFLDLATGLSPLWSANGEPILAAGEIEGQRLVVAGFSPALSAQLPLTAAWPLLLENSILWATEPMRSKNAQPVLSTGEIIKTNGGDVRWREWQGKSLAPTADRLGAKFAALNRIGYWETADGSQLGTSQLLSALESNLPSVGEEGAEVNPTVSQSKASNSWFGSSNPTFYLLWILLAILLIESFLFHRQSVY